MARVPSTSRPGAPSSPRRREWLGGRFPLPIEIEELGAVTPEIILWLELPDDQIVWFRIIDPRDKSLSFTKSYFAALERPHSGLPRRPTHIRVADPVLAAELRERVSDAIEVRAAPTPELDLAASLLAGAFTDAKPSYLGNGRVAPELVKRLFDSAAFLYRAAPWKRLADDQVMRLDIPALDVEGACVSVIGALGESLGFIVFPDRQGFEAFADQASRERPRGRLDLGSPFLCLSFDRKCDVPPGMRREIATHGWRVPDGKAYPTLLRTARDGSPEPLTARDVELATACATALAIFYERHGSCFAEEASEPVSATMQGDDDIEVRLTYPYKSFHRFEKEPARSRPGEPVPGRQPAVLPQGPGPANIVRFPGNKQRVGRNEPCPCGSGKKYKHCHLEADEGERPARKGQRAAVHDLDKHLVELLLGYADLRWGRAWQRILDRRFGATTLDALAASFAVYIHPVEGKTVAEWFLEEHGSRLSPAEHEWLAAQRGVRLSIWEVLAVESGRELSLRDSFTGEARRVHDVQALQVLTARDVILARVVSHAEPAVLCGVHTRFLSPMNAAPAIERVQARIRRARADASIALLDPKLAGFLVDAWEDAVAAADRRAATPPQLQNTDGEPLVLTIDTFGFEPRLRPAIAQHLEALQGCEPSGTSGSGMDAVATFTFSRPGNAMHRTWDNTILGQARLGAGTLEVETNSRERADRLRQSIETACGAALRHQEREETAGPQLFERMKQQGSLGPGPRAVPDAALAQAAHRAKQKMLAAWLDTPVPLLRGRTPRQSVRTQRGRREVDLLLKEMENREARLPEHERCDVAALRRELGFEP